MESQKTATETIFVADGKLTLQPVNFPDYFTIVVWTFTRPADDSKQDFKTYIVKLGGLDWFPATASCPSSLWRIIIEHPRFATFIQSQSHKQEIKAEAWTSQGQRLPESDIQIDGFSTTFRKDENQRRLSDVFGNPPPKDQKALREELVPSSPCAFCDSNMCFGCPEYGGQHDTMFEPGFDTSCSEGYFQSHP